jgi:hypothetical protein
MQGECHFAQGHYAECHVALCTSRINLQSLILFE